MSTGRVAFPTWGRVSSVVSPAPGPVGVVLSYDPREPYAVRLVLNAAGRTIPWVFARELLADGRLGVEGPCGDVTVSPAASDDEVRIELSSPAGFAVLWVDAQVVSRFLDASYRLVPAGTESRHINWDGVLAAMLARGRRARCDVGAWSAMTSPVWTSLVAVGGTLAGSLVGGVVQLRAARSARRDDRREARRGDVLAAVTGLAAAVADHRRAMWEYEDAKLSGQPDEVVAVLLAAQHGTRSAINAPLTTVAILAPALAGPAREAAQATYAMRGAGDLDVLEARRAVALAAHDRLVAAAAEFFAAAGVVVA